jgi:RNA polymerase sigma-70 factor, ECF subfamily
MSNRQVAALRPRMLRMALRHGGNRADAEDLVQATFVKALDQGHKLRPDTNWMAWASVAIRNGAIDDRRRERTRRKRIFDLVLCGEGQEADDSAEAEGGWQSLSAADVKAALGKCSPGLRRAFELHHVAGLSYTQVAAALNVPVRTVGTRLFRARLRVRTELLRAAQLRNGVQDEMKEIRESKSLRSRNEGRTDQDQQHQTEWGQVAAAGARR